MARIKCCAHCQMTLHLNPRIKDQKYCSQKPCQRARKSKWQQEKLSTDKDYRDNQKDCQKRWKAKNPDYWRKYRKSNLEYVRRNQILQKCRDIKRRYSHLAKMDASTNISPIKSGAYYIVPLLAKMDASVQKAVITTIA